MKIKFTPNLNFSLHKGMMLLFILLGLFISKTSLAWEADKYPLTGANTKVNHPCPFKFKRNNGQGTCGGDGQIRVYWNTCGEAPRLDSIYYQGAKITGRTYGAPDQDECSKKGYTSYCIYGGNIPPAKKLTLYFTYRDGTRTVCELDEDPLNSTDAEDDFATTPFNTVNTGNVMTNDRDWEGDIQTVTAQTTTVAGKGTLVLNNDGTYTFTPVNGFTGPVSFPYTTCDNATPQVCASAILTITVGAASPLANPDFTPSNDIDALSFPTAGSARDFIVNISEILNAPSTGQVIFRLRKVSAFTITYNPTATTANVFGGRPVNNNDWIFTEDANFITLTLKPGLTINGFAFSSVGFTITRKAGIPINTTQNITSTIQTDSGGDSNATNNVAVTSITAN